MTLRLTLYGRKDCHLCHEMEEVAGKVQNSIPFELDVLDIDRIPALTARFNALVPVLMHGERELARYRLDPEGLLAYLGANSK